ncbi:MAG: glutamine--fructose-6-phosphate transaminase (isomerizing), partial [Cyclobacteriaceae bacterium]|nr:glutamine--fructose-6-phosphate transaminase (isomerizing) [Cyclobacteriaceae bacterium]
MCGIVAYKGHRKSTDVILKGLQRLEYRGYDSAGISVLEDGLKVYKKKGKVDDLKESINSLSLNSTIGIGHTRWATHGEPNDVNAHPHLSASGKLSIIHNGIIENYSSLRQELTNKGYTFKSETDTEVLINFIEDIYINNSFSLEEALRISLSKIVGAYAIVILSEDHPDSLFAVRKGSPMVIGIGNEEFFFASDATPIIEYTNEVVYLNDLEVATVKGNDLSIRTIDDLPTTPYIQTIEMELESIEKGGYDHFMLKEIYEQPRSVSDCMRGRLNLANKDVVLGGIREYADQLIHAERIVIVACGTSWHAGLVAEYIFEDLCRIPVEVEYASEFRYRNPIINKGDVLIAISQSGETADTLAAMELAKEKGAIIFGVCNVVGSSIARMSHEGVYTHAGPEIGVASTKAFTAQLTVLTMIALKVAKKRKTLSEDKYLQFLTELETLPSKIEIAL